MKIDRTEVEFSGSETAAEEIAGLYGRILALLGEDPEREGLQGTPKRVAQALRFLTSGYRQNVDKVINAAYFSVAYDEMIIVKDIEVFSLCEHHLLPFFGKCHIAYIPNQKVVGLSKLPRLVNYYARRLQLQGAFEQSDCPGYLGEAGAAGGGGDCRSAPPVHVDARGGEAALHRRHQRHAGLLPRQSADAARVPGPGAAERRLAARKEDLCNCAALCYRTGG